MTFDSGSMESKLAMSPLRSRVFIPCMAGLFLFVAGVVVGKALPSQVQLVNNTTPVLAPTAKAHGRFGTPRWLQSQQTLVADVERNIE